MALAMPGKIDSLRKDIDALIKSVRSESEDLLDQWRTEPIRKEFSESASNLAAYVAVRRHDLRNLQHSLLALGLSSLGRIESRVLPTLEAVSANLDALRRRSRARVSPRPDFKKFFARRTTAQAKRGVYFREGTGDSAPRDMPL